MTNRERIIATFKREKIDRIVWQPRIKHWYNVNKSRGTLPEEYKNMELIEIYDDLDASIRYTHDAGPYLKISYHGDVRVKEEWSSNEIIVKWMAPQGELSQRYKRTEFGFSCHLYEVIADCSCKFQSFGENIDSNLDSPPLYNEHLLPYYKKRVKQLHQRHKFCHIHMDGLLKTLLPYINRAGFDGIEAATPLPQGDVSLEELKEAMGNTILLDGIPAILFLSHYSYKGLENFTLKVLEIFSPNLIMGVSDELPPDGDIKKVKLVSEIVRSFKVK